MANLEILRIIEGPNDNHNNNLAAVAAEPLEANSYPQRVHNHRDAEKKTRKLNLNLWEECLAKVHLGVSHLLPHT